MPVALLVESPSYHMGDIKPAWDVPQAGLPVLDFPVKG